MRLWPWSVAVLCGAIGGFLLLKPPGQADFPEELLRQAANQLAASPEHTWPELLAELDSKLPETINQVMVVQSVPEEHAIVLAVPLDSSGEEQAAGWAVPFPRLNTILSRNPSQTVVMREKHKGRYYVHYIQPVDESSRYLLASMLTQKAAAESVAGLVALALGIGLILIRLFRS